MFKFIAPLALAGALAAAPAAAVTPVHVSSAGIYSPGTVTVGGLGSTDYATVVRFTASTPGGASFDLLGFCVDLYHTINVAIGSQLPVSLDYHRAELTTDSHGVVLSSAQRGQIGGLAGLGFQIAGSNDPDRFAKLAAIQQAIWTIEYPTLTFDGTGGLAGQQAYATAFVAAAPGLSAPARALYADNGATQGFLVAGVPEPATWGLMIIGFGLVGVARRRRGIAQVAA